MGSSEKVPFQAWLNLKRKYVTKINPLNISFCDAWTTNEKIDKQTNRNNEPSLIFSLAPHSIAVITMDFRHLLPQEYNWVYGEDWSIAITIKEKIAITDDIDSNMMPE